MDNDYMDEYYELVRELDAREVLRYLNSLGIRNISGEILKYFITDLKKLIKYDLQQRNNKNQEKYEQAGPERLHSASTFCSRMRSTALNDVKEKCNRECQKRPFSLRNIRSAPIFPQLKISSEDERPVRRVCSCKVQDKVKEKKSECAISRITTTASSNLIKVPKPVVKKKSDPVSLYHYYTSLWAKYKSNVPGENNWADLRWHIRQKMAGSIEQQPENKVSKNLLKNSEKQENI